MSARLSPVQDLDAEAAVLSTAMLAQDSPELWARVLEVFETLAPADFYSVPNRHIYEAIREIATSNEPRVDLVTVAARLRAKGTLDTVGGTPYLAQIVDATPSAANVTAHAALIAQKAQIRRAADLFAALSAEARAPIEDAEKWLESVQLRVFRDCAPAAQQKRGRMYREVLKGSLDKAREAHSDPEKYGVPTGFGQLDMHTNGLRRGKLWVVAGRSGMGKTAFVFNVAENVAARGHGVALFSGEMEDVELADRGLSRSMDVPAKRIDAGRLNPDEWARLTKAAQDKAGYPLLIDDSTPIAPAEIRLAARRYAAELRARGAELKVLIVDYLQLYRSDRRSSSRTDEIGELTGTLKAMAKEMRITVIALSQLNRDGKDGRPPVLTDLKDSSSIEQDSDVILFVHRADYFKTQHQTKDNTAQLIVAKGRGTGVGTVEVLWAPTRTEFFDAADRFIGDDGNL